jgi:glycerophosphoryl diester phosphodiesterase
MVAWRKVDPPRFAVRAGLFSWILTSMLIVTIGADPYAAQASPLQMHGALQRTGIAAEAGAQVGIVSHRGAAALAPENTLAAFRLAIEQGVDFIEADVRLTAEGVPVLMHDPELDRTTDGQGLVEERTLDQVRALDAGSWFDAAYAGEQVPTLEEFVTMLVPAPTRAFVELKGEWEPEQTAAVLDLMRSHGLTSRVVFESFELPNLELLRLQGPEFATMLLTRELNEEMLETAIELQVSAIGAKESLFLESPDFAADIHEAGIGAMAYTLNTPEQWEQAVEVGIDFIITDDPVALAEWRAEQVE